MLCLPPNQPPTHPINQPTKQPTNRQPTKNNIAVTINTSDSASARLFSSEAGHERE
jgi:hypothetical protein